MAGVSQRHEKALLNRKCATMERTLRHLQNMRGGLPGSLQRRVASLGAGHRSGMPELEVDRDWLRSLTIDCGQHAISEEKGQPVVDLLAAFTGIPTVQDTPKEKRKPVMTKAQRLYLEAMRQKARLRLALFVACARWVVVFRKCRRRSNASDMVQDFMKQTGEWCRVKLAIKKFMGALKVIHKASRDYLARTKDLVIKMDMVWVRVEDRELESYWRNYQLHLCAEEQEKAESQVKSSGYLAQKALKQFQAGDKGVIAQGKHQVKGLSHLALFQDIQRRVEDGQINYDWQEFRVPEAERKKVVYRYFMNQMKRSVRTKMAIREMFAIFMKDQRDIAVFLRSLGSETTSSDGIFLGQRSTLASLVKSSKANWRVLSEDTAKLLISLCATELEKGDFDRWHDHPSCNDYFPNPLRAMTLKEMGVNDGRLFAPTAGYTGLEVILDRAEHALKRFEGGPHTPTQSKTGTPRTAGELAASALALLNAGPKDVEDVLGDFTPRVREIEKVNTEVAQLPQPQIGLLQREGTEDASTPAMPPMMATTTAGLEALAVTAEIVDANTASREVHGLVVPRVPQPPPATMRNLGGDDANPVRRRNQE
eukprot:TRINITY_DN28398_c0_g1_i1.p1 TRINITY_DN28398_c0_g1~~TRINITY_DN28398_c0_g1_i1.p1  ORF type:complete len:667 (-),score=122.74 TRINITY_DN28398_c0_g1_i1:507-2288(-)